jgi:hypothetical protein
LCCSSGASSTRRRLPASVAVAPRLLNA